MHFSVVSSLIYVKARGLMELFPPKLRNFWKYWELRVLVLLSLMLQIVLSFLATAECIQAKRWKYWELGVLVWLSLTLQIVLIIFGNRKKYTSKTWIRIVLWCAYLMADWVATVALSVISNNLGDTTESIGKYGSLNDDIQLTTFWAPFFCYSWVALTPLQLIPWKIMRFG